MKCRVSRPTYDFYERELRKAIASGTTDDVCQAANGLVRQCFTRRSIREWFIDIAPEWMLSALSRTYRTMDSPPSSASKPLKEKLLPKEDTSDL